MRKVCLICLLLFLVLLCYAPFVFADIGITNSGGVIEDVIEKAKPLVLDARGDAIWDLVKLFLVLFSKLIVLAFIFLIVMPSFFSQKLHVLLFLKGSWSSVLKFYSAKSFGRRITSSDIKEYRSFKSSRRKDIIDTINEKINDSKNDKSKVYVVMGPCKVGKKLLVEAENRAKYILFVERDEWYESNDAENPIKSILEERTELLVKNLIFKKNICIILSLYSSSGFANVPSNDRMLEIVKGLTAFLGKDKRFRKVSFFVLVPAYYQLECLSSDEQGCCDAPKGLIVAPLNCQDSINLLDVELGYVSCKGNKKDELKKKLIDQATKAGLTFEKMVWYNSFGLPKQVTNIVQKEKYDTAEAWIALRDWWKNVYGKDGVNEWFAYIYVLGLYSLIHNDKINANNVADKCFDAGKRNEAKKAVKRMSGDDPSKIDPEHIFHNSYVIESFVGNIGLMYKKNEDGTFDTKNKIFNFRSEACQAIKNSFNLKDDDVCTALSKVFLSVSERFSDISERLMRQYDVLKILKEQFGGESDTRKLVEKYEIEVNSFGAIHEMVQNMILRLGALPAKLLKDQFKRINNVILENAESQYVKLIYEMLPCYIVSRFYPHYWQIDFKKIVSKIDDAYEEEKVRVKSASIICIAYAAYTLFVDTDCICEWEESKGCFDIIQKGYLTVKENIDKFGGVLNKLLSVIDNKGNDYPSMDIKSESIDTKKLWLSIACQLMECGKIGVGVGSKILADLEDLELNEINQTMLRFCYAHIIYSYDLRLSNDKQSLINDIEILKQRIEQRTDCPELAAIYFRRIIDDYLYIIESNQSGLWNSDVLYALHTFLHEWRSWMADYLYSGCLEYYSKFLYKISTSGIHMDLRNIWNDFAERVKELWMTLLKIEGQELDDGRMIEDYFSMYSYLSNVNTIERGARVALLQKIYPTPKIYEQISFISDSSAMAWNVYNCNAEIIESHTKFFICAQIFAKKSAIYSSNEPKELISVSNNLICQAREEGKKLDVELLKLLYEENGLNFDSVLS